MGRNLPSIATGDPDSHPPTLPPGAPPPLNSSIFPTSAGPDAKARAGVETGALVLPIPSKCCQAGGMQSLGGPLSVPGCSRCLAARRGWGAPGASAASWLLPAGPLLHRPAPLLWPDVGIPACAAGTPREPSYTDHVPPCGGGGHGQVGAGNDCEVFIGPRGAYCLGSSFQFRSQFRS